MASNYLWTQGKIIGNKDSKVSPYLKTWISQKGVVVCGVTGEGTTKDVSANWDSPMEGENVGSKFQITSGLLQSNTGRTTVSTVHSQQVWSGNGPTQFNIVLRLYALSDPQAEVMDPIIELNKMISPNINKYTPGGRTPLPITINIGRNAIYPNCVIDNIGEPLDEVMNKDGLFVKADITLSVKTSLMQNQPDIASRYG